MGTDLSELGFSILEGISFCHSIVDRRLFENERARAECGALAGNGVLLHLLHHVLVVDNQVMLLEVVVARLARFLSLETHAGV